MSYQEKRSIVYIFNILLITGIYWWYAFHFQSEEVIYSTEEFSVWGKIILFMIPAQIVITIITQIIFSIVNTVATREEIPTITDERDKLIDLKSIRNAYTVFMIGVVLSMIPVVMDKPLYVMFNLLIGCLLLAQFVWSASQFYFYRRGY
ncbi:MAG: hypothetical protein AAF587_43020 [Bacteroidota bacterium]